LTACDPGTMMIPSHLLARSAGDSFSSTAGTGDNRGCLGLVNGKCVFGAHQRHGRGS
jgi:hypothetical protein